MELHITNNLENKIEVLIKEMTYSPPKFYKAVLYKTIGGVSCDPYAYCLLCIPFATPLMLISFDVGELFTARLCPSPSANFI